MHMMYVRRTSPFVQIIDILRHDQQIVIGPRAPFPVQPGQCYMRRVGMLGLHRRAALIVETQNQIGITGKAFGCRDIFNPVLFPQAPIRAESIYTAFSAYARPCQDHDIAKVAHVPHEA